MDTGFLAEGETMDDDYDLGQDLLPEEVLGIIDQLFCLEVGTSWSKFTTRVLTCIDGMAHGTSIIPNCLHQFIYRQASGHHAGNLGEAPVCRCYRS
jgi:hypothetical protein